MGTFRSEEPLRETSPAAKSEEKRMSSRAKGKSAELLTRFCEIWFELLSMWPSQIFLFFLFSVFREAFTINFVHNVSCVLKLFPINFEGRIFKRSLTYNAV